LGEDQERDQHENGKSNPNQHQYDAGSQQTDFNEEQSQKHFNVKILLPSANKICPRVTCEGETFDVTQPVLGSGSKIRDAVPSGPWIRDG
jgi:hypothetical protein